MKIDVHGIHYGREYFTRCKTKQFVSVTSNTFDRLCNRWGYSGKLSQKQLEGKFTQTPASTLIVSPGRNIKRIQESGVAYINFSFKDERHQPATQ